MGAYCTIDDLKLAQGLELLGQLTDDEDATDCDCEAAVALMTELILQCSDEVFTHVSGRVDFTDPQTTITTKRITIALVLDALWSRRGNAKEVNVWAQRAEDARKELRAIRRGEQNAGDPPQPEMGGWTSTGDTSPVFARPAEGGAGSLSNIEADF